MEPTGQPRPAAPSLLSGSSGKNDPEKRSGRILASLEKEANTGTIERTAKAGRELALTMPRRRVALVTGAIIAFGLLMWWLMSGTGHPSSSQSIPTAANEPAPAAAPAIEPQATATILNVPGDVSTPTPMDAANPAETEAVETEEPSTPAKSHVARERQSSRKNAGRDTAIVSKQKADYDVRLLEALVSHVNGEPAQTEDHAIKKTAPKTPVQSDGAD